MTRAFVNLIGFQAVWFVCALGAARGLSWPGLLLAAVFVALHLAMATETNLAALTLLGSALTGLAVESALIDFGVVHYAAPWPSDNFAPAWIVALWLAFGATLAPMRALFGSGLKAAIAGAVFGPVAYEAGESLGAMNLQSPAWRTVLVLSLAWAGALPVLLALQGALDARARPA